MTGPTEEDVYQLLQTLYLGDMPLVRIERIRELAASPTFAILMADAKRFVQELQIERVRKRTFLKDVVFGFRYGSGCLTHADVESLTGLNVADEQKAMAQMKTRLLAAGESPASIAAREERASTMTAPRDDTPKQETWRDRPALL
jgi:hypothetical protein